MAMTPKQGKFAKLIADGMSQSDAYRGAFSAENMKPETVHKRASELMARGEVAGRVAELKSKLEQKEIWTREMSVKTLVEAVNIARGQGKASEMTGAVKELNSMHGYNAPAKIELDATSKYFDLTKLSAEQLEALGRGILPDWQQYILQDGD